MEVVVELLLLVWKICNNVFERFLPFRIGARLKHSLLVLIPEKILTNNLQIHDIFCSYLRSEHNEHLINL